MALSAYKGMWLLVMFDLPVITQKHRRMYTHFRKELLKRGFVMLQYSIYARYCASEDTSSHYKKYISHILPEEGEVRLVSLTDHQFGKMEIYLGEKREKPEKIPVQLELF
jgi:CRISPR-associated protein Cas2